MANPELGAKQICPACTTKFYDLGKRPAHCPKCDNEFDPEEAIRSRRTRARPPLPDDDEHEAKPAAAVADEDGFEAEPDDAPEIDQPGADDLVVAGDDDEGPASPDDALGVDFAADEDLEEAEDDEVPFLEDEDDDFNEDEIDGLPDEGDSVDDR